MNIQKKQLVTYIERIYCEDCGTEYKCIEESVRTIPYSHDEKYCRYRCPKCSKEICSNIAYPRTIYEEI